MYYKLTENHQAIPCRDVIEWADWCSKADRLLAQDILPGGIIVSTLFVGLDYSFGLGPPLLWQTMILGARADPYQERYPSEALARAGHERAVAAAISQMPRSRRCWQWLARRWPWATN